MKGININNIEFAKKNCNVELHEVTEWCKSFPKKKFTSIEVLVIKNIIKNGKFNFKEVLLPPITSFCNIYDIFKFIEVDGLGPFKIMIGDESVKNPRTWKYIIGLPREFSEIIFLEYNERNKLIFQEETYQILNYLGLDMPKREEMMIVIENPLYLDLEINFIPPSVLGWWNTDFGGYGSRIDNPFEKIDVLMVKQNANEIGYLASGFRDMQNAEKEMPVHHDFYSFANIDMTNFYWEKKFLEKVFDVAKNYLWVIADGSYPGRPLGTKRGQENIRDVEINSVHDLAKFAGLGTFVKSFKHK